MYNYTNSLYRNNMQDKANININKRRSKVARASICSVISDFDETNVSCDKNAFFY